MSLFNGKMRLLTGTLLASLAIGAPSQASAQQAAEPAKPAAKPTEEIVVTGSRIRRSDLTSSAPIQILSTRELDEKGVTNVADALNSLPGAGVPVNPIGDQATFATGRNFVNIFNLGSARTLTLVNGRRFVSGNAAQIVGGTAPGQQVDLNSIPTALVDRIETIQAGGAATYGSDAIAGVINVILKDSYKGAEFDAQYGVSSRSDAENYRYRATLGTNFLKDRGNIAVAGEYNKTSALGFNDRPRTKSQFIFGANPANTGPADGIAGQVIFPNRRIPELTEGGIPYRTNSINLAQIVTIPDPNNPGQTVRAQFAPDGTLVPYNAGTFVQATIASGGDGLNLANLTSLQTPVERYLGTAIGRFDITKNIRFRTELNYSKATSTEPLNQPVYNSSIFGAPSNNLQFSVTNPFLTPQARTALQNAGLTTFFLSRASTDLVRGSNSVQAEGETFRWVAALEGDFKVLDREFYWNASYNSGKAEGFFSQPSIVQARFANAIDAVTDTSGNIVCRVKLNNPTSTDPDIAGCAPLNLFGKGRASDAALKYITTDFRSDFENLQQNFEANIGGDVVKLPGGMLRFAAGYETRSEKGAFTPNDAQRRGIGRSVAIAAVQGRVSTEEKFAEVLLPVFGEGFSFPGMKSLEFDASWRDVDSTRAGKNNAYTYGARWRPIDDLMLRGTMSQTFRAPSLVEFFLPQVTAFSTATDPCHFANINAGPNPSARRANCEAQFVALGLPRTFNLISQVQSATIQIVTGGNPNLRNEEAESWSAGLVYQPKFIPGLTISGDWVDVNIERAIVNFDLTSILSTCYDTPGFLAAPACARFRRDANAQVVAATTGRVNAGFTYFQGLTATIEYETELKRMLAFKQFENPGKIGFKLNGFTVNRLETSVTGTGFDLNDDKGEIGNPDYEYTFETRYARGPFKASWTTRVTAEARFNVTDTVETRSPLTVKRHTLSDASFTYDFNDNFQGRLVVNNVFDDEPPFGTAGIGTYDLLGRYYYVGLKARF